MGERVDVDGPEHTQVWFGPESRPLYGWVSRPAGGVARGGAILCPPMGEEGRAAHRTFRRLAEELAETGIVSLRFDYDGTGDSAGLQDDARPGAGWLASIEAARQYLLDLGAPTVAAVGMRLGATLAAAQAAAPESSGPFSSLVCWDPCLSGRTFLREGEALYGFGETALETPDDGLRHTPGFQYDAATANAAARPRPRQDPGRPAARRPGAAADPGRPSGPARDRGPPRAGAAGERSGHRTGPAARRPTRAQRRPGGAPCDQVVAWLTAGVDDQPAVPVKAPDGHEARAGRLRPGRVRARARADHPARPRRDRRAHGRADRPGRAQPERPGAVGGPGQRGRRAPHRARPALGRVGQALGRRGLPRGPDRPERRGGQPHQAGRRRRPGLRAGVDRRHAPRRHRARRRRCPGGHRGALLGFLLGVRGRDVGARRRGLRDQPAAHALPGGQGHTGLHRPQASRDGAQQAVRPPRDPAPDPGRRAVADLPRARASGTRRCSCSGGCSAAGRRSR